MRYTILISIFLFATFISCKKEKFSTTPSLKFENVNTQNLHLGEVIKFTLSFTYKVPAFPASQNQKGEITVSYGYNVTGYSPISTPKCPLRNDTATFRFVLQADSAHLSDTVSSPPVVIYYQ